MRYKRLIGAQEVTARRHIPEGTSPSHREMAVEKALHEVWLEVRNIIQKTECEDAEQHTDFLLETLEETYGSLRLDR
jgi:hypothetical protein